MAKNGRRTKNRWARGGAVKFEKGEMIDGSNNDLRNKYLRFHLNPGNPPLWVEVASEFTEKFRSFAIDEARQIENEKEAVQPEEILNRAKIAIRAIQCDVISSRHGKGTRKRENFLESPGARCLRDALIWIGQSERALKKGRKLSYEGEGENAPISDQYLARLEFERALSFAFYAGLRCAQLDINLSWWKILGENSRGIRSEGFAPTQNAWQEYWARLKSKKIPKPEELIDIMVKAGTAKWKDPTSKIRFRMPSGEWSEGISLGSFRNNLTCWKDDFTVRVPVKS